MAVILSLVCALSIAAQTTPWETLEKGNKDFQGDSISFDNLIKLRDDHKDSQEPPVTVLSCSDSRVPPELVFHQNLGEIFLVRSAGNVTDTDGIASIEYALEHNWTKLLVVLAHEKCGAVEAAIKPGTPKSPNLAALVNQIRRSFRGSCADDKDGCWTLRTKQNAIYTVRDLRRRSRIIRRAMDLHKISVVVGYYELESGKVVVWKMIK
jgi:carbonic anhydrase